LHGFGEEIAILGFAFGAQLRHEIGIRVAVEHRRLEQARLPEVLRALHTLRGLAAAIGADALASLAGEQEQVVRCGADVNAVDVGALRHLLADSLAALAPLAPPVPPPPGAADPRELLAQLRQLLVERNMKAVSVCEQLAGHADRLGPGFLALSAAVARLDFAAALPACDILLAADGEGSS